MKRKKFEQELDDSDDTDILLNKESLEQRIYDASKQT